MDIHSQRHAGCPRPVSQDDDADASDNNSDGFGNNIYLPNPPLELRGFRCPLLQTLERVLFGVGHLDQVKTELGICPLFSLSLARSPPTPQLSRFDL